MKTFLNFPLILAFLVQLTLVCELLSQTTTSAMKISVPDIYQIKMTTTYIVPTENNTIDQIRVYHALPTVRSWSPANANYGAINLLFNPINALEYINESTNSRYLLWSIDGKQTPGKKLTFETNMTISSPSRSLDLNRTMFGWNAINTSATNKNNTLDQYFANNVHPELIKKALELKANRQPAQTVAAMCQWIVDTIRYDASVPYAQNDINNILIHKRGHCGHQAFVLQQLTASLGLQIRPVKGMNLYAPDGRTSKLQKIRADFTNIHTWAELFLPEFGWVELDPARGIDAFNIPSHLIQNNRWFQNYSIWIRDSGIDKQPEWTPIPGGFKSKFGIENIISYKIIKHR